MSTYIILLAAIALMVILIRKKVPIGPAILAGGLLIWLALDRRPASLWAAFKSMVTMPRSYDLLFALYFVVCLEIEMRKSGILNGLVQYLHHLIPSKKVTLAVMPAFLGMLPSIGGARFSAPIVKTVAEGQDISNESKALINFWFRHIMEFANPIVPGILLTCAIANVSVSSLIVHMLWVSAAMFIIGWFFFVAPLKIVEPTKEPSDEMLAKYRIDFILALLPIFGVFALSMAFGLAASVSLLIIVGLLYPVLRLLKRDVSLKEIFVGAVEKKRCDDFVLYSAPRCKRSPQSNRRELSRFGPAASADSRVHQLFNRHAHGHVSRARSDDDADCGGCGTRVTRFNRSCARVRRRRTDGHTDARVFDDFA